MSSGTISAPGPTSAASPPAMRALIEPWLRAASRAAVMSRSAGTWARWLTAEGCSDPLLARKPDEKHRARIVIQPIGGPACLSSRAGAVGWRRGLPAERKQRGGVVDRLPLRRCVVEGIASTGIRSSMVRCRGGRRACAASPSARCVTLHHR